MAPDIMPVGMAFLYQNNSYYCIVVVVIVVVIAVFATISVAMLRLWPHLLTFSRDFVHVNID